jgi:hypothetical protein
MNFYYIFKNINYSQNVLKKYFNYLMFFIINHLILPEKLFLYIILRFLINFKLIL